MEVILANGTHKIRNLLEVVTIYPKKPGNFGQNLNGNTILAWPTGKFRNKRTVLKGSPEFSNRNTRMANVVTICTSSTPSVDYDQAELVPVSLGKLGVAE